MPQHVDSAKIHALEQNCSALRDENTLLRQQIEALSQHLAAGLNKPALERALLAQPIAYALAGSVGGQADFARVVDWVQQQATGLYAEQPAQTLEALNAQQAQLNVEYAGLQTRLNASFWPQVRRHAVAVQHLQTQQNQIFEKSKNSLQAQQRQLDESPLRGILPFPSDFPVSASRPLSTHYPTYMCVAGSDENPVLMENTPELGRTPHFLFQPNDYLSFSVHCHTDAFYRIDVLFGTCIRANPCQLRLIIRQMHNGKIGKVVRTAWADGLGLLDNGFQAFRFPALEDAKGRHYHIELDSPNATADTGVAVWCHAYIAEEEAIEEAAPAYLAKGLNLAAQLPEWVDINWAQSPLPDCISDEHGTHLCLLEGLTPQTPLVQVRAWLALWGQGLTAAQATGKVFLCGELSREVSALAEQVGLNVLSGAWLTRLQAASQQKVDFIWCCDIQCWAEPALCGDVIGAFQANPHLAAIVPQIQLKQRIIAADLILSRDAVPLNIAHGLPPHTPAQGYRRPVQAASHGLLIWRQTALQTLEWSQLQHYSGRLYQQADIFQHWQANQWQAHYQARWLYRAVDYAPLVANEADRIQFVSRWQNTLPAHIASCATTVQLLNPQQQPTVLVINDTLPQFDEDSASFRLYTLLKLWVNLGYRISFLADNADGTTRYREALEDLGIEVFHSQYTVEHAFSQRHFDYAFICRVEVGHRYIPFVRLVSPDTQIWYDTVDVHYIREQRQAEIENDPVIAEKAKITKRKELHNCRYADLVITVTEDDGKHLQVDEPCLKYAVLPNIHPQETLATTGFAERDGLVFIGNYQHAPNVDAMEAFIKDVLPLLQKRLPEIKVYLVGSYLPERLKKLQSQHVCAVGWVDEVPPVFALRRVFVSYLRYGAGMKGKLGQALSLGLPVVSTQIGAEGMGLIDGETALIADMPEDFADAVCRVYEDEALWQKLAKQGRETILARYGEAAVQAQLQALLNPTDNAHG